MTTTRPRFELTADRIARSPAETRGIARDHVPMLVASPTRVEHRVFADLPSVLRPGDLLVVNTSGTRAAAIDAMLDGRPAVAHLASPAPPGHAGHWVVELRRPDGTGPMLDATAGQTLALPSGATARLVAPFRSGPGGDGTRLWLAELRTRHGVAALQREHGRPITYGANAPTWPLETYQTVFAHTPGSAEMPSAARPFTPRVVTALVRRGIAIAPIVLHCGVSSQEAGEAPMPERYVVPAPTAALVNATRAAGGRIVAVGTTAARALETAADDTGRVVAARGWTDLVLGPARPARVTDGILSGWHEADASHLDLLHAIVGPRLLDRAYQAGLAGGYLWHELGDVCLLLP